MALMIPLSLTAMLEAHCAATRQHGIFLVYPPYTDEWDWVAEVQKACPIVQNDDHGGQAIADGYAFMFCATREEVDALYDRVVGDDGPTTSNDYSGPARVYALTCGPDGCLNENT